MKISNVQLLKLLKTELQPIYWLASDEALLAQECIDAILSHALQDDSTECLSFTLNAQFDWDEFTALTSNLSLFTSRQIIKLNIPLAKDVSTHKKQIESYCSGFDPSNLLIINSAKMDNKVLSQKWFKNLEPQLVFVQIWPLSAQQLPHWINQRFQSQGINVNQQVCQYLADATEGNLLACSQEILKLQLVYGQGHLSLSQVQEATSDSARYDVFKLIDCALDGNLAKSQTILASLKQQGCEPSIILWGIAREIRTLIRLHQKIKQGKALHQAFAEERIWQKRQSFYQSTIKRCSALLLQSQLQKLTAIDGIIKGVHPGNLWRELSCALFAIARGKPWFDESINARA